MIIEIKKRGNKVKMRLDEIFKRFNEIDQHTALRLGVKRAKKDTTEFYRGIMFKEVAFKFFSSEEENANDWVIIPLSRRKNSHDD